MLKFRFEDGHVFDFRGESERSAGGRGSALSDSNQRSGKGFRHTFALAKTYGGLVGEYKLDWFFVKGLATDSSKPGGKYQFAPHFARTMLELNYAPDEPLSDHAPLTVDLPLTEPPPIGAATPWGLRRSPNWRSVVQSQRILDTPYAPEFGAHFQPDSRVPRSQIRYPVSGSIV